MASDKPQEPNAYRPSPRPPTPVKTGSVGPSHFIPPEGAMGYPLGFPADALSLVEQTRDREELRLTARLSKRRNANPLDEAVRFIRAVFLKFVRQAIRAEQRGIWNASRNTVNSFLKEELIPEAYRLAYPGPSYPAFTVEGFRTAILEDGTLWRTFLKLRHKLLDARPAPTSQEARSAERLPEDLSPAGAITRQFSDVAPIMESASNLSAAMQRAAELIGGPVPPAPETAKPPEVLPASNPAATTARLAAAWEDITITFLSEHSVQICVKSKPFPRLNYAEMGFRNRTNATPNKAWTCLLTLAKNAGTLRPVARGRARPAPGHAPPVDVRQAQENQERPLRDIEALGRPLSAQQKRVQEIRHTLRTCVAQMGVDIDQASDPLPYVKRTGYKSQFAIKLSEAFDK